MFESVYEKNRQLQHKLDHLLKQARVNEKKQELYKTLGFEIISASTPSNCAIYCCLKSSRVFNS